MNCLYVLAFIIKYICCFPRKKICFKTSSLRSIGKVIHKTKKKKEKRKVIIKTFVSEYTDNHWVIIATQISSYCLITNSSTNDYWVIIVKDVPSSSLLIIILKHAPTPLNLNIGAASVCKCSSYFKIKQKQTWTACRLTIGDSLTVTLVCLVVLLLICSSKDMSLSSETYKQYEKWLQLCLNQPLQDFKCEDESEANIYL